MRNPEAVMAQICSDTGYTHICPGCIKRTGEGKIGPRVLNLVLCQTCKTKRQDALVRDNKHYRIEAVR